jgi:hypothetical protein
LKYSLLMCKWPFSLESKLHESKDFLSCFLLAIQCLLAGWVRFMKKGLSPLPSTLSKFYLQASSLCPFISPLFYLHPCGSRLLS